MKTIRSLFDDECGVASLEYAIIAAVLVLALIAIMSSIAGKIYNKMTDVHDNALNGY